MIVFYVLLGVVLLFGILAAVAPKKFQMERSIIVNKSLDHVHHDLRSLKVQDKWSPWSEKDPNQERGYKGSADGEVGSIAWWKGNKDVGEGEQELKRFDDRRIETELRFLKPFKATNQAYFLVEPAPAGTKVTWGFSGDFAVPMNIFMLFMNMEKRMGGDFDRGLRQYKAYAEAV
jgi:Polyketide cyclase / dehydrase and lipid transport